MKKRKKGHAWLDIHNRKGDFIEIIVRDVTRARLDSWMINVNDKKRAKQIFKILKERYGIDFGFDLKKERDIEWLP